MTEAWMTTNEAGQVCNTLDELEGTIEQGLHTFIEVGQALAEIRDRRLYRNDFETFEDYCTERWNLDRTRAYDIMSAAESAKAVSEISDIVPENEGQAKALRGLSAAPAAEAMRVAHKATEGKVTAKAIREARDVVVATQAETDVEEFPALVHYAEQGKTADVVRLAGALRGYEDEERERRLEILKKSIAAQKRAASPQRHLSVAPEAATAHATETTTNYAAAFNALRALARQITSIDVPPAELATAVATRDYEIRAAMSWLVTFIESTPDGASNE